MKNRIEQLSQETSTTEPELVLGFTRDKLNAMLASMETMGPLHKPNEQIDQTGPLEKGWYNMDGVEGEPITQENMKWMKKFLDQTLTATGMPMPFVFPLTEGGYHLEWPIKDRENQPIELAFDAEFHFTENKIRLSAFEMNLDPDYVGLESEFNLDDEKAPELFIAFFRKISGHQDQSNSKSLQ